MTKPVQFILDGRQVVAEAGETIWDVAKREGTMITSEPATNWCAKGSS